MCTSYCRLWELGLGEHTPSFTEDDIGGKELLELQKTDFEVREGRGEGHTGIH